MGLLRFDTSAIPASARVTSVKLRFQPVFVAGDAGYRLLVEPYPAASWPIDARDFAPRPVRSVAGSVRLSTVRAGRQTEIALRTDVVRRGSVTALRLLVPGGLPTTQNAVNFASMEDTELAPPTLVVSYAAR